ARAGAAPGRRVPGAPRPGCGGPGAGHGATPRRRPHALSPALRCRAAMRPPAGIRSSGAWALPTPVAARDGLRAARNAPRLAVRPGPQPPATAPEAAAAGPALQPPPGAPPRGPRRAARAPRGARGDSPAVRAWPPRPVRRQRPRMPDDGRRYELLDGV